MSTEIDKVKTFHQFLDERWFVAISEGKKIVEGRLKKDDEKSWLRELKIGDMIIFEKVIQGNKILNEILSKETIKVRVKNLVSYKSFVEMFDANGLDKVLPGVADYETGVKIYRQWYPEDKEKELGILGIFIELID